MQVFAPDGTPLGEAVTTDASGRFSLPHALPEDFRVEATTNLGEVFFSDYRGYRGGPLRVNPLTDLISAYLQRHPQVTLQDAARAVKAHLSLPREFDEHNGTGVSRYTGLLVDRYLKAARERGGLRTPAGDPTSYPLQVAADVGVTLPVSYALDAAGDSFMALLCQGIATGTGEEIGEQVAGWVLSALGLGSQNNVQNQLKDISNQITELGNQISQLATQAAYDNLASQLIDPINTIQTTSNIIANAVRPADAAQISTTAAVLQTYINDFHLRQVGGTPAVPQGMMSLLQQQLKPAGPLYSNPVGFAPLFTQYQYYANYQTLLANCIVELLHLQSPPSLTQPAAVLDLVAANLKTQEALLPAPLPADTLVLDAPNGLVWLDRVFGPDSYSQAVAQANNEALGGFRRWRVAQGKDAANTFGKDKNYLQYFPNLNNYLTSTQASQRGAYIATDNGAEPGSLAFCFVAPTQWIGSSTTMLAPNTLNSLEGASWNQGTLAPQPYMLVCDLGDQGGAQLLAAGAQVLSPLQVKLSSISYGGGSVVTQARAEAQVVYSGPSSRNPSFGTVDLTPYVTWSVTSPDPNPVRISNYPGSEGVLLYPSLNNGSFTINASLQGPATGGQALQATASVGSQATSFPSLSYFQISPRNTVLTAQNNPLPVYATLFSTVLNTAALGLPPMAAHALLPEDWTQTLTWSASAARAQLTKANGAVYLQMDPQAPSQAFNVTAAFQIGTVRDGSATTPFSWIGPPPPGPTPTPVPTPLPTPTPTPTPTARVTRLTLSPSSVSLDYKKPDQRTLQYTLRANLSDGTVAYPGADPATQWSTSNSKHTQISNGGELVLIEKPLEKLKVVVKATYTNRDGSTITSNDASVEIDPQGSGRDPREPPGRTPIVARHLAGLPGGPPAAPSRQMNQLVEWSRRILNSPDLPTLQENGRTSVNVDLQGNLAASTAPPRMPARRADSHQPARQDQPVQAGR